MSGSWERDKRLQAEADAAEDRRVRKEAAVEDERQRREAEAEDARLAASAKAMAADDGLDHRDPGQALEHALATPSTDPEHIFNHHRYR